MLKNSTFLVSIFDNDQKISWSFPGVFLCSSRVVKFYYFISYSCSWHQINFIILLLMPSPKGNKYLHEQQILTKTTCSIFKHKHLHLISSEPNMACSRVSEERLMNFYLMRARFPLCLSGNQFATQFVHALGQQNCQKFLSGQQCRPFPTTKENSFLFSYLVIAADDFLPATFSLGVSL